MTKYNKKYCEQLLSGMREDGSSVPEVCRIWGISKTTYYNWVDSYPDFKDAHDYGNRDCAGWWHKLARNVASGNCKGNAGVIALALKNIDEIHWQDKLEVTATQDDVIHNININVLPFKTPKVIEHDES